MDAQSFVKAIREEIIAENLDIYRSLFQDTSINEATDPYWYQALSFYADLSPEQKETLFKMMRQSMVDTISNLFSLIDGASCLEGQKSKLKLILDEQDLSGNLQDIFLEMEELP